jgi:hypothetical protein
MTVDVDSWSSLLNFYSVDYDSMTADTEVNIEEGLNKLLRLFKKHGVNATFFVPGTVAKRHPQAIRGVHKNGHEVACHGLSHWKDEFLGDFSEQERNLKEATQIIEQTIGHRPIGFRAPCLRINRVTFQVLEKLGYIYDSSVVPTFVPGYYGFLSAPKRPYYPYPNLISSEGSYWLLEIPVSVNPLLPLPLSAAWMRNLGSLWVKFGVKANFIFKNPVMFYIHPRDVVSLPRLNGVPWHLYKNIGFKCFRMLDDIIGYARKLNARFMRAADFARYIGDSLYEPHTRTNQ